MARREFGRCAVLATSPCSRQGIGVGRQAASEMLATVLRCGVARQPMPAKKNLFTSSLRIWDARHALWTPVRSFTAPPQAPTAYPNFSRYTHPYLPPEDRNTWAPELNDLAEALTRHDEDTCWRLFEKHFARGRPLPYSLWYGVCSLTAQGPAPQPWVGVYAFLDRVCRRLHKLFQIHAERFSEPIPTSLYRRYIYLLLKRAERLDAFQGPEWEVERKKQAEILVEAVENRASQLDTPLLGRAVFRLARLGRRSLHTLVHAFVTRDDLLDDPSSAAQPFNAIVEACVASQDPENQEKCLLFAVDVLRLAYERCLPIRGMLVQTLLTRLGDEHTRVLLHACSEPATPVPPQADTGVSWPIALHRLARTRPMYLAQRAAVALCRNGDPRAALALIRAGEAVPYDVYAAAISALAWRARERRAGHDAAMTLALHTLDALRERTEFEADQQMYGELIRAWEATLYGRTTRKQTQLASDLAALVGSEREWPAMLRAFTEQVLSRMEEGPLLRPMHHTRLLAINIREKHFLLSKRLYERARNLDVSRLPFFSTQRNLPHGLLWLFTQATKRAAQRSFAVRLYHDMVSFGYKLPLHASLLFVRTLLAGDMPTVAQQTVLDLCESGHLPNRAFAPGVLHAFFQAGLFEPALALAEALYATRTTHWDSEHEVPTARLEMYATCLYEASHTRIGHSPEARARLWTLFEEFRLALAHALAHRRDDGDGLRAAMQAYHGAIRLRLIEYASCEERQRVLGCVEELLEELRDLVGEAPTLTALVQRATSREALRREPTSPNAMLV